MPSAIGLPIYFFNSYLSYSVICSFHKYLGGFPGGISGKEPVCQPRRPKRRGIDPWVGKIPGGGHGNPLQYSFLEDPKDRQAWLDTVHGVTKNRTQLKRFSTCTHTYHWFQSQWTKKLMRPGDWSPGTLHVWGERH